MWALAEGAWHGARLLNIPELAKVPFIRAAGGGDRQISRSDVRGKWCWAGAGDSALRSTVGAQEAQPEELGRSLGSRPMPP